MILVLRAKFADFFCLFFKRKEIKLIGPLDPNSQMISYRQFQVVYTAASGIITLGIHTDICIKHVHIMFSLGTVLHLALLSFMKSKGV